MRSTNKTAWRRVTVAGVVASALIATLSGRPAAGAVVGADVLYTLDADFDQGVLINVNHDAPFNDQLQLNVVPTAFPFINVAASARGTMVRIDVNSGAILGEYKTAPQGRGLDPSRTTVDLEGNVWTTNRAESGAIAGIANGSVVKIGLIIGGTRVNADETPNPAGDYLAPPFVYNTCVDRDGDDLIKTSRGLGDIRPWPDVTDGVGGAGGPALVQDADDECILVYQRLPDAPNARHVSVDANNDVWVGGYPLTQVSFHLLDGADGSILTSFDARSFGCGGYGGLIDGTGILWSASISQNALLRYDPLTLVGTCTPVSQSYGLGIDTNGFLWNSMFGNNSIVKVNPLSGVVDPGFPKTTLGASGDRGVAVTPVDNHVWVANSAGSDVSRLDNNGNVLKVIALVDSGSGAVGNTPTGVAVDANGKVWVTNLSSNNVMRIDPNGDLDGLGAVDLTVSLGPGAGPYNYSDMTGLVVTGVTASQGTWNIVQDSNIPAAEWYAITWNTEPQGSMPLGTSLTVEARAAESEAGLSSQAFVPVANGAPLGGSLVGRFIEVRATLKAAPDGTSPVLSDIQVVANRSPDCTNAVPSTDILWPPNHKFVAISILGVTDPDGDPVTITVDSIFQDEPVNNKADGNTAPDGLGVGTSMAEVRAERNAQKNGRVYHIGFTADDGRGGMCTGEVTVGVPHDQGKGAIPVDDGALFDSTTP